MQIKYEWIFIHNNRHFVDLFVVKSKLMERSCSFQKGQRADSRLQCAHCLVSCECNLHLCHLTYVFFFSNFHLNNGFQRFTVEWSPSPQDVDQQVLKTKHFCHYCWFLPHCYCVTHYTWAPCWNDHQGKKDISLAQTEKGHHSCFSHSWM